MRSSRRLLRLILTRAFAAYNVGTCAYMIWVGLGCLNLFINSIIWNGNAIDSAPVFCDICEFALLGSRSRPRLNKRSAFRLTLAMDVAIPICSLVINRRLFFIATSDTVVASRKDVSLCRPLPVPVSDVLSARTRYYDGSCLGHWCSYRVDHSW